MYEARKICNLVLSKFDAVEFDLTNLRINKLLFFIHAESLRLRPEGLIRNHFEAWQFGPVIRPVFDAFKAYKEAPIAAPAQFLDYATGQRGPIPFDDVRAEDVQIIVAEFKNYSRFTTSQLVSLSHIPGGPWDIVYRATLTDPTSSPRIPNELISDFFGGGARSTVRH
ncbi:type II toxin-antitoxin system antitoxin SocA domain-containing protein [Hyphomicrobium sp. D-2]|uniref:Panacea domain-containing protein n=1 Tax=Hyphomicrobium sp. D-2 TaxID=3041621 RepID=UPI002454466C|nr:type II toxin-antitoxin system antitoxin SocA domain-containing protein [Hyphomicrobium sp. D-2]MDH4981590.1 DUF4065 domain-containing protein [Hyphomicrobium sp. D-2]